MSSTEWVWVSRDCSLIADSRKRENAKLWTKISEHDFHPLKPGHSSGGAVPKKRGKLSGESIDGIPKKALTQLFLSASKSLTPSKVEVSAFMDPLSLMAAQDEQNEGVLDLDEGQDSQPAIPQDQRYSFYGSKWEWFESSLCLFSQRSVWGRRTLEFLDGRCSGARSSVPEENSRPRAVSPPPRNVGDPGLCPISMPQSPPAKIKTLSQEDKSPLRARLELLEGRTTTYHPERDGLAHRDLVNFVDLLNNQLAKHWKDDKRLPVINLTLQISKMMGEPGLRIVWHDWFGDLFLHILFRCFSLLVAPWISYYPCLFFLLSDLVTYFGQLVYDRLGKRKPQSPLP